MSRMICRQLGSLRHEQIADRVFARLRQLEAEFGGFLGEKLVRDLHQDAGAVAHARVGADRAAMLQIAEDAQPVLDDQVRLAALDVGDEADAAGVLVERRIVQTLRRRRAGIGGGATQQTQRRGNCAAIPRSTNPALLLSSLISSCLAGASYRTASGVLTSSAGPLGAAAKAQPISRRAALPVVAAVAAPVGRHRCQPRLQRPAPWPPLLGQQCCPNRPCQILPRHTRLVHAGIGRTFRFVAAAPSHQARRGPRAAAWRNAVAPVALRQIARRVNRLTVAAGKSRGMQVFGYGAEN